MKMKLPSDVIFHHDLRLLVYRPRGILDAKEVTRIVEFLEHEEDRAAQPFNRFTDNSKLDAVDLDFDLSLRFRFIVGSFMRSTLRSSQRFTSTAPLSLAS